MRGAGHVQVVRKHLVGITGGVGKDDEGSLAPGRVIDHFPYYTPSADLSLVVGSHGCGKPTCQVCHSHLMVTASSSADLCW